MTAARSVPPPEPTTPAGKAFVSAVANLTKTTRAILAPVISRPIPEPVRELSCDRCFALPCRCKNERLLRAVCFSIENTAPAIAKRPTRRGLEELRDRVARALELVGDE